MTYLHNATKDWTNVSNIIINYKDENIDYNTLEKGTTEYGSIVTKGTTTVITSKNEEETGRIENLKARMPRYDEVHGAGKCLMYEEAYNFSFGSCPLWLSNYLNSNEYVTGEGLQNISGIHGYWTLSSIYEYSGSALCVLNTGNISDEYVNTDSIDGVRPVITIPLHDLSNYFE